MRTNATIEISPAVAIPTKNLKTIRKPLTNEPRTDIVSAKRSAMLSTLSIHVINSEKNEFSLTTAGTSPTIMGHCHYTILSRVTNRPLQVHLSAFLAIFPSWLRRKLAAANTDALLQSQRFYLQAIFFLGSTFRFLRWHYNPRRANSSLRVCGPWIIPSMDIESAPPAEGADAPPVGHSPHRCDHGPTPASPVLPPYPFGGRCWCHERNPLQEGEGQNPPNGADDEPSVTVVHGRDSMSISCQ